VLKNIKIRTKTLAIVFSLIAGIGLVVIYGLSTLSNLQKDFARLKTAEGELTLTRGMDRQTHRVWVMVLKLSNIEATLGTVFDVETLGQQTAQASDVAILGEEADKALAEAFKAQQDFQLLLSELEGEIKEQDALGVNVEKTKEFLARFKKESDFHDEAITAVIEANKQKLPREEIIVFVFRGLALGSSMISMLVDFNAGLEQSVQELERSFDRGANNLKIVIWSVLIVSSLFMTVMFLFIITVIRAIGRARSAAVEIARGNMDVEVDITGKDEVAELSQAIDKMRRSLKVVMEKYEKKIKS